MFGVGKAGRVQQRGRFGAGRVCGASLQQQDRTGGVLAQPGREDGPGRAAADDHSISHGVRTPM
ncbi:MAG: hypothetical protein AUI14_20735 [Actinobacteria bacterium 13_2_20CM_2_71_6]|nr:MAG: hypothetical protein AUI14_20735 [Actinobacteria bacterium 13_2_20CM_2_71_6]